ncbi:MAG: RNA polymerase sigma factor [Eubacteriales bacterium]
MNGDVHGTEQAMDNGQESYRRFLGGDRDAFDNLVNEYHDNLIFFIYGLVKNITAAEDIAADVFMELIVHKHRYNFKSSFKTYLYSIARHKSIDFIRRESRYSTADNDISEMELPDVKTLEDSVIENERQAAVHNAMKQLNEDYRTVLHLTYFESVSSDDICRIMKKNKKQIANLLYRAKEALSAILIKGGIQPNEDK